MKLVRFKPFIRCKYIRLLGAHHCSAKMAFNCARCYKKFGSKEALNQHLRSSARHTNGGTRNRNRNTTAQPLKANKNPNHPNMSAPQRDTQLHRPFRCQSCDRSFKFQCALDSHLQNSKAHGSRGASAIHVELDVRHIQNETTAEEGAALVSDIAQRPAIPDGQQNTNENISEDDTSRWSAIARPEMSGLYEELSKASHSQDDLLKNRYILHPYNSSDIAGLRKCVNCGSKIIYLNA